MNILLTGGAGYIGSYMAKILNQLNHKVVIIDNLSTGTIENIMNLGENIRFFKIDLRDQKLVDFVFSAYKIDTVIHLAALSTIGKSMVDPTSYFDNNVGGLNSLLTSMKNFGVKNIIFDSTSAVYGNPDGTDLISESNTPCPMNVYAETKLIGEKMIEWCAKIHGLNYIIFRNFIVAGSSFEKDFGDTNKNNHLIPTILETALGKRSVFSIFGTDYPTKDGTVVRDYIHIYDLITAHINALNILSLGKETNYILNISNGKGYSVKEIVETVKKVTNKDFKVETGSRRKGDAHSLIGSNDKIKKYLNWYPKHGDLETMIKTQYEFMLKNMEVK